MRNIAILFLLLLMAAPSQLAAQNDKKSKRIETIEGRKYYMHSVEKGQTLYQIAKIYGLDVNDIVLENPEAIDGIKPGQVLKVPTSKPVADVKPAPLDTVNFVYHNVQQGQTVYSIARLYAITVETIHSLNPETKGGLKAGQLVKLPKNPATLEVYRREHGYTTLSALPGKSGAESKPIVLLDSVNSFRSEYNVAFLLPFNLDFLDAIDVDRVARDDQKFPQKSEVAIEFYQGIRLALDTLKKKGHKVQAYFYDVDDNDTANMRTLLAKPELQTMHLIIGPLYAANFVKASRFAKERNIPIVSPVSQQNKILFRNPYVSKVTPAVTTQLEEMGRFIALRYAGENIILLTGKDTAFSNPVKKRLKESLAARQLSPADSLKEVKTVAAISSALSSTKKNIIIVPSNARVFVTDMLSKLQVHAGKFDITLFGMPSWNTFDNLDLSYLNSLKYHYVTSSFIDYDDPLTKQFILAYRAMYKTDPSSFVFQGYDVTNYYIDALAKYGRNFQAQLSGIAGEGLQTSFNFISTSADSGFENTSIRIIGCSDFKQSRVR